MTTLTALPRDLTRQPAPQAAALLERRAALRARDAAPEPTPGTLDLVSTEITEFYD